MGVRKLWELVKLRQAPLFLCWLSKLAKISRKTKSEWRKLQQRTSSQQQQSEHRVWLAQLPSEMENYDRRYWQWKAAAKLVIQKQRQSFGLPAKFIRRSANMKSALSSSLSLPGALSWLVNNGQRSSRGFATPAGRQQRECTSGRSAGRPAHLTLSDKSPHHLLTSGHCARSAVHSLFFSSAEFTRRADDFSSLLLFFAPCPRPLTEKSFETIFQQAASRNRLCCYLRYNKSRFKLL